VDEKEVVIGQGLEVPISDGLEVVPPPPPTPLSGDAGKRRKRAILICSIVIAILLVIGVAVGAVLGTRHRRDEDKGLALPQPTLGEPSPALKSRDISTVKWSDGNGTDHIRLYYLADSGEVWEGVRVTDSEWEYKGLGFIAKGGSSIAAAVSQANYAPNLSGFPMTGRLSPAPDPPPTSLVSACFKGSRKRRVRVN